MANMIQAAKDSVNALLAEACAKAAEKGQLPAGAVLTGSVEIPKDTQNGDFAANHAMAGARALRMPPRKIAEALVENLALEGSWFASVRRGRGTGLHQFPSGSLVVSGRAVLRLP